MNKNLTIFLSALLVLVVSFALVGAQSASADGHAEQNIMDIVAADERFDTLEAAIKAAGLADTVASTDVTLTVFAPTDAAFAALPAGTVESLLADPEGALTNVLLYHVVGGEYPASSVVSASSLPTLQGTSVAISTNSDGAFVNDAQIIVTDVVAKNGIVHVIDAVLVPSSAPASSDDSKDMDKADKADLPTIADIAVSNGSFDTLVAALSAAGLVDVFTQPGDYTVFAPTDDAFAQIPAETLEALLADPSGELTNILLYHVVGDSLSSDQIYNDDYIPTLDGRALVVERADDGLYVSDAKIIITDIQASNGVIHVIDTVMIP